MRRTLGGFTLIELMVSISIIGIMSTIMLARYPDSAVRLNLANITNQIALTAREAQLRGSSVDVSSGAAGYGIFASSTEKTSLIYFFDSVTTTQKNGIFVGDGIFTTTPINETKSIINLPANYKISALCIGTGFPFSCGTFHSPPITSLSITFDRPNPQPLIYINGNNATPKPGACIEISSPKAPQVGHVRSVRIFSSGLIVTGTSTCQSIILGVAPMVTAVTNTYLGGSSGWAFYSENSVIPPIGFPPQTAYLSWVASNFYPNTCKVYKGSNLMGTYTYPAVNSYLFPGPIDYSSYSLNNPYSVTCTDGIATVNSNIANLNLAPEVTSPTDICSGGSLTFSWTPAPGYSNTYLRYWDKTVDSTWRNCGGGPSQVCLNYGPLSSYTFTPVSGHTYAWWVHTRDSYNNWSKTSGTRSITCP